MAEWITSLAPIAASIVDRIMRGDKVKDSERSFLLLYSMAQDIKELRIDFARFNEVLNQLRVELAELRGKTL